MSLDGDPKFGDFIRLQLILGQKTLPMPSVRSSNSTTETHLIFIHANLRFTSYFNFSFHLFLSNCWFSAFGFLQDSAVKPRFWNFFSVNHYFFAQQPRIRIFNLGFQNSGFQFPVSNTNWYFIFQVKLGNGIFWSTLKSPILRSNGSTLQQELLLDYFWIAAFFPCSIVLDVEIPLQAW